MALTNYALQVAPTGPGRKPIDADVFQCQVFGVVLAERSVAVGAAASVVENYWEAHPRRLWPNMVVAVRDYTVHYTAADDGDSTEDPMHAVAVLASGPLDEGTPPLADVAIALAASFASPCGATTSPPTTFLRPTTAWWNGLWRTTSFREEARRADLRWASRTGANIQTIEPCSSRHPCALALPAYPFVP